MGWIILSKVDVDQITNELSSPNLKFLLLAMILVVPNFGLKFFKWHYLLKSLHIKTDVWTASRSYLAGLSIGLVTPARAGEMGRVLFLSDGQKVQALGVVAVDKLMDLLGILLFSLLGARVFLDLPAVLLLTACICSGILVLLGARIFAKQRLVKFTQGQKWSQKIQQVFSSFEALSWRVLLTGMLVTLVMFLIVLLQCHILLMTFIEGTLHFKVTLFAYPLVILANILPITIGGLGVREGVAVFCLSFFDVPPEVAVAATFYLFLINVVAPALLGCIIILRSNRL